jgi:hypothetical protein
MTAAGGLPANETAPGARPPQLHTCSRRAQVSAGSRTGLKVVRPTGRSTLTPALLPACLEPGREPAEKGHIDPLDRPLSFRDDLLLGSGGSGGRMNLRPLGYEPYDSRLCRRVASRLGWLTSADGNCSSLQAQVISSGSASSAPLRLQIRLRTRAPTEPLRPRACLRRRSSRLPSTLPPRGAGQGPEQDKTP